MTAAVRTARAGEVAVFAGLTLLGAGAFLGGLRYGLFTDNDRIGPGMMPAVAGALLCALGAVLTFRCLTGSDGGNEVTSRDQGDGVDILGRTQAERIRHLWIVFCLLLLAILAVAVLGFLVAFGAFVLVVSVYVERRGAITSLAIAVGACVVIYLVFELFLHVPLPTGLLGV